MAFGERDPIDVQREKRRKSRIVRHADPGPRAKAERTRLEKDLGAWLRHHGGKAFSAPWSPDHLRVIEKAAIAIRRGGLFAVAMPRGQGKSTILKWLTLYVLLTGRRKYVVIVAATAELAQGIIEFCRQQIMESESLHAHYPHVTEYARRTDGKAIKAKFQLRADGKASGIMWSKTTLVFPEVLSPATGKPYASNGAILEAHGLTGAIRGKWRDTKTGKVLRPDFVILDDPQDRSSAESPSQCAMRERIITGDVLGLAGPDKRIAAVMPCTIIRKGDLADRFLDHKQHPEWQGETFRLVNKWPDAQDTLWAEYAVIYREDMAEGRGPDRATAFYRARREEMDAGAEVSWPSRVRDGEISALQTAENLLIEMGSEAFHAEMQNDPQEVTDMAYNLTTEIVLAHSTALPKLALPEAVTVFTGFCDINRAGLHWCVAGFAQDMTGHSPAYGRWPAHGELWKKNAPELDRKRAIFGGLKAVCDGLANTVFVRSGVRIQLGTLLIDRGYEPDVVHKFAAAASYPFRVMPARGYAAHKYYPHKSTLVGRPFEGCHVVRSDFGQFLAFDADRWRETAQRAWLADPGAPGGFTLFQGEGPRYHIAFAEQVVAEKLSNKYETDQGIRWEWRHQPGALWDWGDAVTGCWVGAAAAGLSPSGEPAIKRQRPKAHVVIHRPGRR